MAYATKYLFKWESAKGTTREIRILKDGYSGSVIQRALGRAPILKKQKNGAVFGTSLEFYAECRVEGEFTEFYTTNPKAYKVQLYAGNTLLWQGYVTPELYSEPDIAPPFDVQVIATDGIGELKLYDFEPCGVVSLRSMFTYLLGYTGLGTDVYLISSLKAGSSGAGALLDKTINLDYMAGESCYEVLTYLLDTLNATITWWRGAWIVARETNVTFTNSKVRYFNTAGNSALLAGSVQTLGKMYVNDVWPVGQLSRKVDPAKKSVTVQAPWHPVQGLLNPYMTSDVSWIKNSYVTYDTQRRCYAFSEASSGGSAFGCIKQSLSMLALRVPMSFAVKGTGFGRKQIQTQSGWFWANGLIGVVISYQVGSTTYILREGEEGYEWQEGQLPNFDPFYWTQRGGGEGIPSKSFDTALADRENSEELRIDSIPTFDQDGTFPAGTLMIQIAGQHCDIYSAELNITIPKGYQDRLHLDNGARGEGGEVEVAIGRETSDIDYYKAFLQGILLDSGSLITSFKDDAITTGMDFLSFISRDYARSFALPRIVRSGTVQLEAAVEFPPLVLTKAAVDYWLETWSWNMYEDELEISARSLPTASITVDSEVISEASGTTSSEGRSGGGTSSMSGAGGAADFSVLEQGLASGLAWLSSRIGSIESWLAEPQLDELLVGDLNVERQINLAGATLTYHPAANGNAAYVYLDTALVTKGDQVTNDGVPGSGGGGGGGKNWLAELLDVEENMHPSDGQVLAWKTGIELNDGTTGDGWGNLTLGALATKNNITTSFVTDIETWIAGKDYATQAWVQEQGYVTTSGVTSIAMTVPTGFSVTGSPITSTGTLALTFASGYSLPTTAKQSNWDTAYGWGNHATAGYAMQTDLAAVDANVAQGLANLAGRMSSVEAWLECPQIDELLVGDINVERELNLGGAIFKWVPPQGNNAGYVLLDTHFVTLGDQVTNEGNPSGGGGGGGKNWLAELLDVEADMEPTVGQVLAWQDNVERNDGTTAPGWANLSLGALALRDSITTSFITDLETWIAGKGYVTSSGVTSVAMTVPTGFAIAGSPITATGTLALTFASGYSLPTDAKQTQWDTAYTNSHTHANKSVLDGITSTKVSNWDTAYTNNHTHSNKSVLDGISSTEVSHWDTAYTNNHTHANKGVLDGISSSDVTNWNTAFTNNHTHSNKTVLDGISSTDVSHWDTAYGWGNHALAGYAYASDQEKIEAALAAGLALLAGHISGLEDWLAEPQLDELLVGDINVERVLNVGGATFVYHPAEGANAAYIYLDTALVTAGDQVTNDGNPGSGGGGSGKSWLSELLDVKASMAPSAGQVLMWQNNVVRNDGTTAPGWANASLGALATRDNITTAYVTDLETWIAGKGYVTTSGVTSIAVTVPTGFAISGSPVTSTGTVAIDFATGYSLPTTAKQTNWDTAYSDHHTHSNKTTLDGITSAKVSNWDSAYSWGNHASVGYAMGTDLAAVERGAVQADAALSARIGSLEDWFSEPQLDELLVGSLNADNINLGGESLRSIPNSFLANSALTINGSVTALGGSFNTANITAGTAGTSSATSGVSFAIPYVTVNKYGIVTAYGTHTHSISQANMFGSSAIGSSALPVYYNGSALTVCAKGDLFSALSSSAATNLSVTVAGQTRSITNLYATYDSEGSNIATQAHAIERILAEGVAGVSARVKSLEDWFAEPQVDELLAGAVNVERTLNLGGISMRASGNKLYIGDAGHYIEIKGTNSAPILYMNVTLQTAGDQAIA